MLFKKLAIFISVLLFAKLSFAVSGLPGLEIAYERLLWRAQDKIVSENLLQNGQSQTCNRQMLEMRADGRIDITIVFGYMDVSGGQNFNDSGSHLYGNGNVLDLDAKQALKSLLVSSCTHGRKSVACGFRGNGDRLRKTIRDRWTGQRLQVNIQLASPAVTGVNRLNIGQYSRQQQRSSQRTQNIFLNALQAQDVTIYMGHARSGGGPDFSPPILKSNGHVNYPLYRKQQKGIGSMIAALRQAREPSSVIGVLACKSTGLFASRIRRASPSSILITADELFDYKDILPTGYGIIEAVVGQRCAGEFSNVVKVQPKSSRFLNIFY